MRKIFNLVVLVTALSTGPAFAWNEKGHYVVCRLAWLQMNDQQRAAVTEILKKHPHYTEYQTKAKPEGFTTDEWVFMRAGAWADWIRSGSARSYGHSTWHYVNYPVCFPGMGQDPEKHQPPAGQENAVWAMNRCLDKIKNGTDEEKAVYLTWLCHLVGDIHQPLHCVALFSDKYPEGDKGGNAIRIRISSSPTNLHSFWDGLLGRGVTAGNIGKDVAEIQAVMKEKAEAIQPDLDAHKTPESWAKEGTAMAPRAVYLDGELLKARDDGEGVLQAPAEYAPACGRVARIQVGKAGVRLAEQVRQFLAPDQPNNLDLATLKKLRLGMSPGSLQIESESGIR